MLNKLLILLTSGLALCCSSQVDDNGAGSLADLPVESYQLVDFVGFNETIPIAFVEGKAWPQDPIAVARKFIASHGARSVSILRQDDPGERADSSTIIIVEDGFGDDSLRGRWHRFRMARSADDTWRIVEVRRAYRCWRGRHLESFSEQLCP